MRCWDPEQARAFLDAARDDRLYALYVLALSTGMREGELLALRWRDVRLPSPGDAGAGRARLREHEQGSVHVQNTLRWRESGQDGFGLVMSLEEVKTDGSRRHIQLSAVATEALREHRTRQSAERPKMGPIWRHHDLVFCNTIGGAIRASTFRWQSFLPLIKKAGVPRIRPYDMRHTAATLLLLSGVHPKVVSEMLGHSAVTQTLSTNSHVLAMIQRDAEAAMDRIFGSAAVSDSDGGRSRTSEASG